MGNSIRRVGLLNTVGAGEDEPFHYKLGRKVSIDLSEKLFKVKRSGSCSEKWIMSYEVDRSTCTFTLRKSGKYDLFIDIFSEVLDQDGYFSKYSYDLDVETVTDSDSLLYTRSSRYANGSFLPPMNQYGRQIHGGGRVTETHFWLCGTGDIQTLTVLEKKMTMEEKRSYEVTLAHYFATSAGINDFSGNSIDVGLSVVVKIRASHGNLDITVEGPDKHPASGLRYLFDEAMKSQIWKPTLCPHCASIQKQRRKMIFPSDSDDSESVPWARRHGSSQKNSRGVENSGKFNGNGNGNYTENNYTFMTRK
ncbi:hypothetical protein LR48_Vigan10g011500 [Vigna angularis]|uniref:Uncharacterized protein n=2 Tax=Phaseolus angularis TaxID=3914 RepID=A0A0L9VGW4_PHAAN|nr:uncharacterized protein HKW66_Vig0123870 [Vigna angularis]KOM54223.1 hypothetical protein LR48_Vigan10g011500 [Vigna angularis]BAU02895.1 hypothetical protein VIGAN_11249100 [Vigna angularis var. angularis]